MLLGFQSLYFESSDLLLQLVNLVTLTLVDILLHLVLVLLAQLPGLSLHLLPDLRLLQLIILFLLQLPGHSLDLPLQVNSLIVVRIFRYLSLSLLTKFPIFIEVGHLLVCMCWLHGLIGLSWLHHWEIVVFIIISLSEFGGSWGLELIDLIQSTVTI